MPELKKKMWFGTPPKVCNICKGILGKHFIDGLTCMEGRWALMCTRCHKQYGFGLGTGKGQKYNTATLEKEEG